MSGRYSGERLFITNSTIPRGDFHNEKASMKRKNKFSDITSASGEAGARVGGERLAAGQCAGSSQLAMIHKW